MPGVIFVKASVLCNVFLNWNIGKIYTLDVLQLNVLRQLYLLVWLYSVSGNSFEIAFINTNM